MNPCKSGTHDFVPTAFVNQVQCRSCHLLCDENYIFRLNKFNGAHTLTNQECDCGSVKANVPIHSDWCKTRKP